ncbi:mucin-5AC isoform X2 [Plutella xylostella]|uniref:mucin-5AC isoform X2 n=1 Tax=Plutella xylostella TaxID=51655 RepID=UPI002032B37D|nr:mucin-5AC isoform X2 [Plutella xylostella]
MAILGVYGTPAGGGGGGAGSPVRRARPPRPRAPATMPRLLPALCLLHALAHSAALYQDGSAQEFLHSDRDYRAIASSAASPRGCLYAGRWYAPGAAVPAAAACLRCRCAGAALACARRACAALPDPPPPRCHVLHRRGACCPELHCPNGVVMMEQGASARLDDEAEEHAVSHTSLNHACVSGGAVFAAGSAMESAVACEQCFCLGGARRCVRPRCLPPPPGCTPRPAPPACCPQRYYCDKEQQPKETPNDCRINGRLIPEGERVVESERNCSRCFCLRGAARCQPLACAPPLLGCRPLLRAGQCCAHQYQCDHGHKPEITDFGTNVLRTNLLAYNALSTVNIEDRSFHAAETTNFDEASTLSLKTVTEKSSPVFPTRNDDISTNKVKRKTNEPAPVTTSSQKNQQNISSTTSSSPKVKATTTTTKVMTTKVPTTKVLTTKVATTKVPTTKELLTTEKTTTTTEEAISSTETVTETERTSTDLPEGSIKIVINGTINCTTEFSSVNTTVTREEAEQILKESIPRTPLIDRMDVEEQTFNPNDIITDRTVNGFDENESFTINVTSSLITNTSHSGSASAVMSKPGVVTDVKVAINATKKTKEDDDYDYAEPTLPPSLPNLKIIPFVAADAVLDEEEADTHKDTLTYPMLEREDKFPVYYPKPSKDTHFATRREDVYHPTNYPMYTPEKEDTEYEAPLTHEEDVSNSAYPNMSNDLASSVQEYTVSASVGSPLSGSSKAVTKMPSSTTYEVEKPSVNLFSPPVETEGGFVPKGPGIIGEYFGVYPSTPAGPHIPHLTTSMQLDPADGECSTSDGRRVAEGDSVSLACSVCTCAWGELHCSPRPCPAPPGCRRRPAGTSTADLCCGELVCDQDNYTEPAVSLTTESEMSTTTDETKSSSSESSVTERVKPDAIRTEKPPDMKELIANNTPTINTAKDKPLKKAEAGNNADVKSNTTTTPKLSPSTTEPTLAVSSTTVPPVITEKATTTADPPESVDQSNESPEYDEDEEDNGGFSFGNVLKLLLSETYDATTAPPAKKKPQPTTPPRPEAPRPTPPNRSQYPLSAPSPTPQHAHNTSSPLPAAPASKPPAPPPAVAPFVPLPPHRPPYTPQKHLYPSSFAPTSVNRIDHLVLGEATAIRRPSTRPAGPARPSTRPADTARPFTSAYKPTSSPRPPATRKTTTSPPEVTTREEVTVAEVQNSLSPDVGRPPPWAGGLGGGAGLLKLAGCNIYGRMYRVGRIIAELSSACQECRCTEQGVQCRALAC